MFEIWLNITDVSKTKQGGFLLFSLDDETQDSLLDLLTSEDINKADGAESVLKCLDKMFGENESLLVKIEFMNRNEKADDSCFGYGDRPGLLLPNCIGMKRHMRKLILNVM